MAALHELLGFSMQTSKLQFRNEDDVAELCDRDYDVAEDECAGNNVAETDSEQFGLRNMPLSEKENNNSPNSGTDDDADDIPLSELLARLNSKKKY
ncbi:hypothetical protein JTB14_011332 [Gonioctena quinquepunctata]|nr:hypothetical protein JTB14_011332 [Gonioctena quinquepunctata]